MKRFALFLLPLMAISFLTNCGGKTDPTPPGPKQYTVTFDTGEGGSIVPSQKVLENHYASKPADPTREGPDDTHGYVFNDWQLDGVVFDFNTPITKDINLKATWDIVNKYTVTFDPNGGKWTDGSTDSKIVKVKEGEKATKPSNPTKNPVEATAYTFDYWELNNARFDFTTPITGDITLKAKWSQEARVCSVIIYNNELYGKTTGAGSYNWNSKIKLTATPRDGYVFMGWQKGEEIIDTNQIYEFNVADDVTLTTVYKSRCLADCQVGFSLDNAFTIEKYTGESEGDIAFPDSVLYKNVEYEIYHIAPDAFKDAKIKSIHLPNTLKTIGYGAFRICQNLTSISIPSGVMTIMGATFYNCSNLSSVTFATDSELISIGNSAFFDTKIESITMPPKLEEIGNSAFAATREEKGCLKSIDLSNSTINKVIKCSENAFLNQSANMKVKVKNDLKSAYEADSVWSKYDIIGV